MLKIHDRDWSAFQLKEIFIISPGKRLTKSDMKSGKRPFVGATEANNGITNYVSNTNVSLDKGVLGVNYNGSVVETFYHPYECIFSDDVKRFRLKNIKGNRLIYLFLKIAIIQQKSKYAYGYKFNEQRMNQQSILLPVVDSSIPKPEPDWGFMEGFILEREQQLVQGYVSHTKKTVATIDPQKITPLAEKEWQPFEVVSYFTPKRGREGNMTALPVGEIPLISAKKVNNGLKGFVSIPDERLHAGHVITLNNDGDGGAGLAYYQPFSFALDTHVTSLRPENQISHFALIFVCTAIAKQRESFGHGHSISDSRLQRMKVMLPATSDNAPDWEYMEQYAKNMTRQQANLYLKYVSPRYG